MHDLQVILFVGDPGPERLDALLASFREDEMLTVLHCASLGSGPESAAARLEELLPDLVCVFADGLKPEVAQPPESGEDDGEDALAFCRRLRERTEKVRPVLVVQSAAGEEERIQYLLAGADDILGADLSPEEFRVRLLVHLRRNLDFAAHEITGLPGLPLTAKVAQRRLNRGEKMALLTVALDELDVYHEAYGELPTRQVLKTVAALLGRLIILPPDFVSHTDENHFVIMTQPEKAEKLAALLCRQFETASPNFYSEKDRKQGYMVSVISSRISRRVPLMSLSIGIASTQTQPLRTFPSLFNASQQMGALARMQPGNSWQSDRLRLTASGFDAPGTTPPGRMSSRPGVLVVETDAALAYLLKTTLAMEGYAVDVVGSVEDARRVLSEKAPARRIHLAILDAIIHEEETGLLLAGDIHRQYPEIRIICTSSLNNRQRVLQAGAHLYLPRPFELSSLFLWIHRLLLETGSF
jgi:DNA-binding response OmpR family regulator